MTMRIDNLHLFFLVLISLGILSRTELPAQSRRADSPTLQMNAEDFDHWVDTTSVRMDAERESPIKLTLALVARLKSGIFTTDHAIITSLSAWITYDQRLREYIGENSGTPLYGQSLAYLDGLLLYMYGRPDLEAQLWERKAFLHRLEGNYAEEKQAVDKALTLLNPAQVKNDQLRMDLNVRKGTILLAQQRKGEAETAFLEVLNYDFQQLSRAPEALNLVRESYVQAGFGLIECRRGDAKGLHQIQFVDEVKDRLDPVLKAAIEDSE